MIAEVQARPFKNILHLLLVLVLVYFFLLGINIMGEAFKSFGLGFAKKIITITSNPFISLFIGMLATSLVQSSSTTTSIIVSFVAAGTLTLENAVPMIMGANIGTTVTNTIVSLGHIHRRDEFERAIGAAIVHDFFNVLCVIVFLPLELMTGFLHKTATFLTSLIQTQGAAHFKGPLSYIVKPITKMLKKYLFAFVDTPWASILLLVIGLGLTFFCLFYIVKSMKSVMMQRVGAVMNQAVKKSGYIGIAIGCVLTTIVQSSSVTTSLLVPMAAAGLLTVNRVYPITLGANIGTTFTAILAAMATDNFQFALTIAFVHLLFNIFGTSLFFSVIYLRNIPPLLAQKFARIASRSKLLAVFFVVGTFYILPCLLIYIWEIFK